MMNKELLIEKALEARGRAYTPYSHFSVGAALLCESGKIYTGSNIENAAYSPTNCAERTAVFTAVHAGERGFAAIAVVGGPAKEPPKDFCTPCGVCRQVLAEFAGADFILLCAKSATEYNEYTLGELLPSSFSLHRGRTP